MIDSLKIDSIIKENKKEYKICKVLGRGSTCIVYEAILTTDLLSTRCILKEYAPITCSQSKRIDTKILIHQDEYELFQEGLNQFESSLNVQHTLKEEGHLINETPGIQCIVHTNQTIYVQYPYYAGTTLDACNDLSLLELVDLAITIAKIMKTYHEQAYLFMDLKPENIFVLYNSQNELITDLVLFIDSDSLISMHALKNHSIRVSFDWCAPEQKQGSKKHLVGIQSEVYTFGEFLFYLLFKRHSKDEEHRSFSKYPFMEGMKYYKELERFDIQKQFSKLFTHTLRSSIYNRYKSMDEMICILNDLDYALRQKEYLVYHVLKPIKTLIGRKEEIKQLDLILKQDKIAFVYGIGGIGKTSLIKQYCYRNVLNYDHVIYFKDQGNMIDTFIDDSNICITTIHKEEEETRIEYYKRKLNHFKQCIHNQQVLVVIDDFNGIIDSELKQFLELDLHVVLVSRSLPTSNIKGSLCLNALSDQDIRTLFETNLNRSILLQEEPYVKQIIEQVHGHTLMIMLLARQIQYSHLRVKQVSDLIQDCGFSSKFKERVDILLEEEQAYKRMEEILSELFKKRQLNQEKSSILKVLSCLNHSVSIETFKEIMELDSYDDLNELIKEGWITYDDPMCMIHPIIQEVIFKWEFDSNTIKKLQTTMYSLTTLNDHTNIEIGKCLLDSLEHESYLKQLDAYQALIQHVLIYIPMVEEHYILTKGFEVIDSKIDPLTAMKIYDRMLYIALDQNDLNTAHKILEDEKELCKNNDQIIVLASYYENQATYYDYVLDGNYDVQTIKQRYNLKQLIKYVDKEIRCFKKIESDTCNTNLVRAILSRVLIYARSDDGSKKLMDQYLSLAFNELSKEKYVNDLLMKDYYITKGFYELFIHDDLEQMQDCIDQAILIMLNKNEMNIDYIDFFIVPISNLYLEAGMVDDALRMLYKGIDECLKQKEIEPYRRRIERLETYVEDVKAYMER